VRRPAPFGVAATRLEPTAQSGSCRAAAKVGAAGHGRSWGGTPGGPGRERERERDAARGPGAGRLRRTPPRAGRMAPHGPMMLLGSSPKNSGAPAPGASPAGRGGGSVRFGAINCAAAASAASRWASRSPQPPGQLGPAAARQPAPPPRAVAGTHAAVLRPPGSSEKAGRLFPHWHPRSPRRSLAQALRQAAGRRW
jgi:hypothetical protein